MSKTFINHVHARLYMTLACLVILAAGWARGADRPELLVALPAGTTWLSEIGIYRVGWQSYGRAPLEMPLSWMGHFDPRTGIAYRKERVLEREGLLLHSPWRVPAGKAWVEYELDLPRFTPIHLSFGIAMRPDIANPDKSDGVTFSCGLTAEGQEQELMRKHYAQGEWLDYTFDLSGYAGRTVRLRLQVEPGPKNNASFDFSYFGNARITAGAAVEDKADMINRLTGTRAYRAVSKANLAALSNTSKNGVIPSNLLPGRNTLESRDSKWHFTYQGDDCELVYFYEPKSGTLDDFTVQVDGGRTFRPAMGGGATISPQKGEGIEEMFLRGGKAVEVKPIGTMLEVRWEYPVPLKPLRVQWRFGIVGKALAVSACCDDPRVSHFSLGEVGFAPMRKTIEVPYLAGLIHYLPIEKVFVGRYLDWTASHASMCPQGNATYEVKTDGTRNSLFESGYVAVSPEVGEVLPNIPHPPSPYLRELGPRVMLDIWGHHENSYAGDAKRLRELKDNGVDHLAIIQHVWQRYGYDVKLPDHLPADPRYGGDEGMKLFGQTARDCGYLWSLHENYIDLYPDAPSYDPAARVLQSDGTPSPAWYNPGTKIQSFGLKCNRALGFAQQTSSEAHRRYGTTAAYLDVHTCVPPWHQLDHDASQPMAAMAMAKVKHDRELFQFERDTHRGPLFGEGANHFYWAGLCDGVEAQVAGGEDHSPFLDFDLLKIHPQMVNHGMGYYERWFRRGYEAQYGVDAGSVEQFDKYRAMELAYGHAGFLGNRLAHHIQSVVREHHLMHPVQRLYGTARPTEIRYEVDGHLVTASAALVGGETSRQRIRYENGLTLWVNWDKKPWHVEGRMLPQWGFLALGPDTEVYLSLREGHYADYAECPEYVFADARTWFDFPYVKSRKDIEPRLRDFQYLGNNRASVTYEWVVNDTLENDYHCFVHGINAGESSAQQIVFQGDHSLSRPTRQWRKGEVFVDGPHELRVDGKYDRYDLVMGLFQGDRIPLKGNDSGAHRIRVARLKVEKQDGHIKRITAESVASASVQPDIEGLADFKAHINPPGTWIDFGKVATDGAVKVNREKDRLVIFPYPRDHAFRVSLKLKSFVSEPDFSRLQIRAMAALTQTDLGRVEYQIENGRVLFNVGKTGAGRYVVTWEQARQRPKIPKM